MDVVVETIRRLLGLGRDVADVSSWQMALRTVVVYAFALAIVRLGSRRFLSKASAFDMVVAIMLGSIMSSAITGSAPFLSALASGAALVGAHWILATMAYRIDWVGPLVKGNPVALIKDGSVDHDALRRSGVSELDLEQALRTQARITDPSLVRSATLERDGTISVLPADVAPRVVEVSVERGVQTVRVEIR
jgi:uncharacterized membrane protein YcaP (DUF421 family)